jgi:hypothetical protein
VYIQDQFPEVDCIDAIELTGRNDNHNLEKHRINKDPSSFKKKENTIESSEDGLDTQKEGECYGSVQDWTRCLAA